MHLMGELLDRVPNAFHMEQEVFELEYFGFSLHVEFGKIPQERLDAFPTISSTRSCKKCTLRIDGQIIAAEYVHDDHLGGLVCRWVPGCSFDDLDDTTKVKLMILFSGDEGRT
jgi:hypothetical protein